VLNYIRIKTNNNNDKWILKFHDIHEKDINYRRQQDNRWMQYKLLLRNKLRLREMFGYVFETGWLINEDIDSKPVGVC
jgi:hypothetical protein